MERARVDMLVVEGCTSSEPRGQTWRLAKVYSLS